MNTSKQSFNTKESIMTNYRKRQQAKEFKRQAVSVGFPMLAVSIMCAFIFLAFI